MVRTVIENLALLASVTLAAAPWTRARESSGGAGRCSPAAFAQPASTRPASAVPIATTRSLVRAPMRGSFPEAMRRWAGWSVTGEVYCFANSARKPLRDPSIPEGLSIRMPGWRCCLLELDVEDVELASADSGGQGDAGHGLARGQGGVEGEHVGLHVVVHAAHAVAVCRGDRRGVAERGPERSRAQRPVTEAHGHRLAGPVAVVDDHRPLGAAAADVGRAAQQTDPGLPRRGAELDRLTAGLDVVELASREVRPRVAEAVRVHGAARRDAGGRQRLGGVREADPVVVGRRHVGVTVQLIVCGVSQVDWTPRLVAVVAPGLTIAWLSGETKPIAATC